ncbi:MULTISPECIES: oxygenase MpaB family protein [unclassified Mycobacterium]|uniref:oxygenase MpaB family protein n=1 Tax=unclassified Mycobacterium TaxID=2642494 RepID=UPI0029C6954E|nr:MULTISPECIES: oxygenase MpaB family protein [unclassified Mycobacterium]
MWETTAPIRQDDYGFFGPGSPSWKVWASPTALIGFQRSVVLEHFDPFLAAAVADSAGIYSDPTGRLDRTLAYFLTVAVADGRTAVGVSDALMRVHAKAKGVEPISGARYSANNPDAQLWIHVTGWHSVLKCYERYGPGPLSPAEEQRYWAESRIAAELQTCKPSDVPASRAEVRQYFADVRPKLCTSEHADSAMRYLLWTPRDRGVRLWAGSRILAPAAIATLPKWMRHMGGFDQPAAMDAAVAPMARAVVRAMSADDSRLLLAMGRQLVPATTKVLARHLKAGPPARPVTVTPSEARERLAAHA